MCKPTFSLFTTRKRSLGQGNIFTPVCHSVHRGVPGPGGYLVWGVWSGAGAWSWGHLVPDGSLVWGGAWSGGVPGLGGSGPGGYAQGEGLVPGGACSQGAWWRPPGWLPLRPIRILPECILVVYFG